ncbi:hypothetical protein OHB35_33305 [Streptomyces phaeochromogenes]|uniref:Thymidylate kinase-like domain-containing protein n=1 Tax=Streptomyces phaeochromogenes TaxID=1923 RepID=A0ABZ1HJK2_STRPH|nr:hypothetical protein [Streptomyces phaeochromogenes]WSD17711.1 hypothetical protein OHB35_33305 [Streptomyces phaeochromogenes]
MSDWLRTCSGTTDPWELGTDVLRWGTMPPQEMLGQLGRSFDATLPDGVILLDLPVAQALQRTRDRARGSELHETGVFLSATRQRYDAVLDWLAGARPELAVRRIDCADRSVDEVTARVRGAVESIAHARCGP